MKYLKYLLLSLFIVGVIVSCDMFNTGTTQTKVECLEDFFGYARSGDFNKMYLEMHPDGNRGTYTSGTTFNGDTYPSGLFTSGVTYYIEPTGSTSTSYQVTVNPKGITSFTDTYTFREDGEDNWLLLSFEYNGTPY